MTAEAAPIAVGRDASIQRRRMLSQGKGVMPAAKDRPSAGFRLELRGLKPEKDGGAVQIAETRPAAAPSAATTQVLPASMPITPMAALAMGGREASMARRRMLSQGKGALAQMSPTAVALPSPSEPAARAVTTVAEFAMGGREASMARRRMLAQGKAALAALSPTTVASPTTVTSPTAVASPSASEPAARAVTTVAEFAMGGREASMARRRMLAQGKAALVNAAPSLLGVAAPAVSGSDPASSAAPVTAAGAGAATDQGADVVLRAFAGAELQTARRAAMMRSRRQSDPAAIVRPPRRGDIAYPPKVAETRTAGAVRVTGYSEKIGQQVTGVEAGRDKPISGTSYIGPGEGSFRNPPAKVGFSRTAGGLVVSGTQVRSRVRITGDEASGTRRITGEADQTIDDDVSERRESYVPVPAQFQRQANPHGMSVFGTNLGRSIRHVGSRERSRERAIEVTEGGAPISGTAVGRSTLVTGDEPGSCRALTGTQYLSPARRVDVCGGPSHALEPTATGAAARRDPVTGAKVTVTQTWGGQRVTGTDFEHTPRVTGDEQGACNVITGTPYLGAPTMYSWCPADRQAELNAELNAKPRPIITGDVPLHDTRRMTGTGRGADLAISGTAYWQAAPSTIDARDVDPVQAVADAFSVTSPQRAAQLSRRQSGETKRQITGAFAVGEGKITGAVEFGFADRALKAEDKSARQRITGHGSVTGPRITGSAWNEHDRVTGTEGSFATNRNPSEKQGKPHAFAHARIFKRKSPHEPPRRLVTGVIGWTPKSAAIVTLSGGAQG